MSSVATTLPKGGSFVGQLRLSQPHGPVGSQIRLTGEDLPANTKLDLVWDSYRANWAIESNEEGVAWNKFQGLRFSQVYTELGQVWSDSAGGIDFEFTVPLDYGGMHDLYLIDRERDVKVNKIGFRIDPSFSISPDAGPLGTKITVEIRGLNVSHPIEGWYRLWYDNKQVGLLSGVTTRGVAKAKIPATGRPGKHIIEIKTGALGQASFLQLEGSPFSHLPIFKHEFTLTDGDAILPEPITEQLQMEQVAETQKSDTDEPQIRSEFSSLPCGSATMIYGRGFNSNTPVALVWQEIESNDVAHLSGNRDGTGHRELHQNVLAELQTDETGSFEHSLVHQGIQGGVHKLEAVVSEESIAHCWIRISPRPHRLQQKSVEVGQNIGIEIDGIGWTEVDKIMCFVYDNSFMGYVCGNDLMGKVKPVISATGQSGWHFVQVYPTLYKNRDYADAIETPFIYRIPFLNWEDLPHGYHCTYAFQVEEAKS